MDAKGIVSAIRRVLEWLGTPDEHMIEVELDLLLEAKAENQAEFQTAIDNLDQIISYYSQNPEGTAHNG